MNLCRCARSSKEDYRTTVTVAVDQESTFTVYHTEFSLTVYPSLALLVCFHCRLLHQFSSFSFYFSLITPLNRIGVMCKWNIISSASFILVGRTLNARHSYTHTQCLIYRYIHLISITIETSSSSSPPPPPPSSSIDIYFDHCLQFIHILERKPLNNPNNSI